MLNVAFKEWAVICRALAEGRQSVILRKGGISEGGGGFQPDHSRFWFYPTYLHEHRTGIKREAWPLFDQALAEQPISGHVRLNHFAEVAGVFHASDWKSILALDDLHFWAEEAVRMKFNYRTAGLFVLAVRVFTARHQLELEETPAYRGCKTWVELNPKAIEGALMNSPDASANTRIGGDVALGLATRAARPVLDDETFAQRLEELHRRLGRQRP